MDGYRVSEFKVVFDFLVAGLVFPAAWDVAAITDR
jgi:hypothetical protein